MDIRPNCVRTSVSHNVCSPDLFPVVVVVSMLVVVKVLVLMLG